jgi:hypothetical protein
MPSLVDAVARTMPSLVDAVARTMPSLQLRYPFFEKEVSKSFETSFNLLGAV